MKTIILAIALLAACGDNLEPDPTPDAGALPACVDVGCPDLALCTADGACTCNATGEPVACRR